MIFYFYREIYECINDQCKQLDVDFPSPHPNKISDYYERRYIFHLKSKIFIFFLMNHIIFLEGDHWIVRFKRQQTLTKNIPGKL